MAEPSLSADEAEEAYRHHPDAVSVPELIDALRRAEAEIARLKETLAEDETALKICDAAIAERDAALAQMRRVLAEPEFALIDEVAEAIYMAPDPHDWETWDRTVESNRQEARDCARAALSVLARLTATPQTEGEGGC